MCNSEPYPQFIFVTWKGYRVQVPESFILLKLQIWQDVWRVSNKHFMCSPPFQLHIWKLINWHKICLIHHCKFSDLPWGSLFMPHPPGLFSIPTGIGLLRDDDYIARNVIYQRDPKRYATRQRSLFHITLTLVESNLFWRLTWVIYQIHPRCTLL